ncbi:MAG: thioredoxin [Caldicoprobacterales bacterium]|jgi:thioredoxin 1|nr:thioredoxin [Clostridiales bacterium]
MVGNVIQLNQQNFAEEVLSSKEPVLVDFYADWCGPCKMISPIIDQIAREYKGKATVAKINVDENRDLALQFGVMSIPTLIFFKDGREVQRILGARPKGQLTSVLDSLIA